MKVNIIPGLIFKVLLIILIILLTANILGLVLKFYLNESESLLISYFDFNREHNIPSNYSVILLFTTGIITGILGLLKKYVQKISCYIYWFGFSLLFLYMSIDEKMQIHERLDRILKEIIPLNGFFYYIWVIPYGLLLLVLGSIFYFKFIKFLPSIIRNLFIISTIIYTIGGIGFEILGGYVASTNGSELIYSIFYTFEETLEILGISLFLYTFILYLQNEFEVFIHPRSKNLTNK